MTSYMKQYASAVLAMWLVAWAIVILQPCCDSIFAESHHDAQHSSHHDHASGHDTTQASHHSSEQDCRIAIENLDDLAAPVTNAILAEYDYADNVLLTFNDYHEFAVKQPNRKLYHHTHPPPADNPIYLTTLRIRV